MNGRAGQRRAPLAAVLVGWALLGGCASTYYDPPTPPDAELLVRQLASPLDMERTYRRMYTRLDHCLAAGSGYHVHPRFERAEGRALLLVVSGIRLERYSFLTSYFSARFDVFAQPQGSRMEIRHRPGELEWLVAAAEGWVTRDEEGCGR